VRQFDTGATRDTDEGKLDYEGFLSPIVLKAFAEYMHENRVQSDGNLRDSDNWQKGIPRDAYMKSLWRHFHEAWTAHRYGPEVAEDNELLRALMAMLFNVQGYAHEILVGRDAGEATPETCAPVGCGGNCSGGCGPAYRAPFTGTPIVDDESYDAEMCKGPDGKGCMIPHDCDGKCPWAPWNKAPGGDLLEHGRLAGRHEGAMSAVVPTGAIDRNGDA